MDNQDQENGGGGARKRGPMDVRSDDVVIISDETTAEEETVDGALTSGITVDLALTLMTGSRNDGERTVGSPEPAGSSRSVSEDGRTLNLIESLTEAPEAAPESSGGARNNAGIIRGGEWNSAGELDFINKGVVAVGNPGSAFTPFTRVRAQAAAVVNQSPPVQEQSPLTNVLQASDQSNSKNDKKLDDGGGESSDQKRGGGGGGKNSSEVAGKSPLIITGSEEPQRMGKAEAVGQSSSRNNAGIIWGGERNSAGELDFINKGVVAVGNPGSAFTPFTRVRAAAAESSGGARNNAGIIRGGERNSDGELDFINKGVVAVGNPGSAFTPFTPVRAVNQSPAVQEQTPPINVLQHSDRSNRGGGGKNSSEVAGKSPLIITGKAEAVDQSSSRHNENLAGSSRRGGRYYSQTSGGGGGSGHNSSIAAAVTIAALPPLPPRPRDGYSQTSGGGGGSGHNSSIAAAVTIAALPPLPPRPRNEYVCMFCRRARFSSIVLLEEHMSTCPRRVINLG